MQKRYDVHEEDIDATIKEYAEKGKASPLSELKELNSEFIDSITSSKAGKMYEELTKTLEATDGQIQVMLVDRKDALPRFNGRPVWGHAGTYITVFALKGEVLSEEGRRAIIGRIFHEIRARSTKAGQEFKELGENPGLYEAGVLLKEFEEKNGRIEKEIRDHGFIKDDSLREEFADLKFDEKVSPFNRDYATLKRGEFIKLMSVGAAVLGIEALTGIPIIKADTLVPEESMTAEEKSVIAMLNWMYSNIVPNTGLLKSFEIPKGGQKKAFDAIQGFFGKNTVESRTMAVIVRDGQVTYDSAVATLVGIFNKDSKMAQQQVNTLWENGVYGDGGMLAPICATDSKYYDYPTGSVSFEEGMRAWRLRLISAVGLWRSQDPFDPNKTFDWNDYHAIAGENFWNIILAMQLSFAKHGKGYHKDTTEFKLADELFRFGFKIMQVKDGLAKGAFRMAPKGTHSEQDERLGRTGKKQTWYFDEVSTENNLSAFSAIRLAWEMTGDLKYKKAMDELKGYFKNAIVFDKETGGWYFDQGMHFNEKTGKWQHNNKFATDCQTWAISMLGPETIDEIFGEKGTAYALWETLKNKAGIFDKDGNLISLDFGDYRKERSGNQIKTVEWSGGGIEAGTDIADYYGGNRAAVCNRDAASMYAHINDPKNKLKIIETKTVNDKKVQAESYVYSDKLGLTLHGWLAAGPIPSAASTGWMGHLKGLKKPVRLSGGEISSSLKAVIADAAAVIKKAADFKRGRPVKISKDPSEVQVEPIGKTEEKPAKKTGGKVLVNIMKDGQNVLEGTVGTWGGLMTGREGSSMRLFLNGKNQYGAWEGSWYVDCSKSENWPKDGVIRLKVKGGKGSFRLRIMDKGMVDRGQFDGNVGYGRWHEVEKGTITIPISEFNSDVSKVKQFVIVLKDANAEIIIESIDIVEESGDFGALMDDTDAAPLAGALWRKLYGTGYLYPGTQGVPGLLPNETFGSIITRDHLLGMVRRLGEIDEVTNGYNGADSPDNGQAVMLRHAYITDTRIGIVMDVATDSYAGTFYAELDRLTGEVTISDNSLRTPQGVLAQEQGGVSKITTEELGAAGAGILLKNSDKVRSSI